jgi:hypothetical protein
MPLAVACVVEGHGEVDAVPILIRRIAASLDPGQALLIPTPIRVPRDKVVKPGELERAVDLAARKIGGSGAVLVLLDSEGACPAQLGPALLRRVANVRPGIRLSVVVAKHEYESWFRAAATSLRGLRGLAADLEAPPDPETIQGAKEWLTRHMEGSRRYAEPLDQPALTARFDLDMARRVDSFDKCYREIVRLLSG